MLKIDKTLKPKTNFNINCNTIQLSFKNTTELFQLH